MKEEKSNPINVNIRYPNIAFISLILTKTSVQKS